MHTLQIPDPEMAPMSNGTLAPLPFRQYVANFVAPQLFWRTPEGVEFAADLFALIDGTGDSEELSDRFHEALCKQMVMREMADMQSGINPIMARLMIRYARAVYMAQKKLPAKTESPT